MIFYAGISSFTLGMRGTLAKFSCEQIGTPTFTMINFYVDFIFGLFVLTLWGFGQI